MQPRCPAGNGGIGLRGNTGHELENVLLAGRHLKRAVHPGGQRLIGPGAIRSAFEALFDKGVVQIQPERIHRIDALACSVHHLTERLAVPGPAGSQTAWVTATNVFHKTAQGWRLVARHASPGVAQDHPDLVGRPSVLH